MFTAGQEDRWDSGIYHCPQRGKVLTQSRDVGELCACYVCGQLLRQNLDGKGE